VAMAEGASALGKQVLTSIRCVQFSDSAPFCSCQ
jgi:hypothetical protein